MEKKKKIGILVGIIIIILIAIGISYAFLRNRIYGSKGKIVYHTSGLDVVLEEDSTTSLELTGAVPMSDADGLKSDKVYRFTVVNRSISNLKYKIYLDNDNEALSECGEACEFIPDRDIKYEIKKDKSSINTLENRELADGRLVKGGRETYELKLWINSEAENEIVGKYFFGKIRVEVVQDFNNPKEPKLASNMVPVRYDGANWVKASKNNWYDYEKQEWANAVTIDKDKVLDLSGNNNHATLINGASLSDEGGGVVDGEDDYIDCGFEDYDFKNQIAFVVRFKLLSDFKGSEWNSIFGRSGYSATMHYNSKFKQIWFGLYSDEENKWYDAKSHDLSLNIGEYYTIVGTYDGTTMKFYFNGNMHGSVDTTMNIRNNNTPITIGRNPQLGGDPNSNIEVSDVLIFDKGLSDEEIQQHYSNEVSLGTTKPLAYYNFKKGEDISNNTIIPMDLINTMWVWIPRYSYTIGSEDENNYYGKKGEFLDTTPTKDLPGEIDVKFVDKNIKDRGSAKYKVSEGVSGWYTPNAFTFGKEELEGIWVGKFETSNKENCIGQNNAVNTGCDLETLTVQIKPNVKNWSGIRVSTLELVSMGLTKKGNIYGFDQTIYDSHAMKNTEWALMTYLSQSKYGKLGNKNYHDANKEIYMNNYTVTGCSSGVPSLEKVDKCLYTYDQEIDGTGASTTGNIYGIYDTNGGSWEYVMGVYAPNGEKYSGANSFLNSGYTGKLFDGTDFIDDAREWQEDKYYDTYGSEDYMTACDGSNCKGHALNETAIWYGDLVDFGFTRIMYPWLIRGGGLDRTVEDGIYAFGLQEGRASMDDFGRSFRIVLTPIN